VTVSHFYSTLLGSVFHVVINIIVIVIVDVHSPTTTIATISNDVAAAVDPGVTVGGLSIDGGDGGGSSSRTVKSGSINV
jgi:hypothetical protein